MASKPIDKEAADLSSGPQKTLVAFFEKARSLAPRRYVGFKKLLRTMIGNIWGSS